MLIVGIIEHMRTKDKLQQDLTEAMRENDATRKNTLRMALSAIRLAEVDKRAELDEQETIRVLQKEAKSYSETIEESRKAGRTDLVEQAQAEAAVLEAYLPESMSHEDLQKLARQAIEEVGAENPGDMGKVMKVLMPRLEGRATGQEASQTVRNLLQQ